MSGDPPDTEPALRPTATHPQEDIGGRGAACGAPVPSATVELSSGRRYEMEAAAAGDRLIVRGKDGEIVLQMEITDAGPVLSFAAPDGERPGARRGPRRGESSVPPRRAASPPLSAIVPLSSGKGQPGEGEAEEPVEVPRAMPLPSIKPPPETELVELDGGNARSGVTLRRPPGEASAGSAPTAPSGAAAPDPAAGQDPPGKRGALPSLSLQQYAALCAESSVGVASSFDRALLRHGIADRDLWKAIDRSWQDRLEREPILTLRWMELTTRYREHLTRR
ncbi:hypothetical protein [Sorangium cellulosum]|uniref:hypothetical protein n=1 Tax=Sorangium cellulosum TaxID=56 RepID=UPI00040CB6C4|nr:hypothetical protein [Sorangium cellulosum]